MSGVVKSEAEMTGKLIRCSIMQGRLVGGPLEDGWFDMNYKYQYKDHFFRE